jgi:hypothetical protein
MFMTGWPDVSTSTVVESPKHSVFGIEASQGCTSVMLPAKDLRPAPRK